MTGLAVGGATLGGAGVVGAASSDEVTTTDFGIATPGLTTQRAKGLNEKGYITTRTGDPVVVGEFDLNQRTITNNYTLPTGTGSWALCASGDHMYVGTYWPGDLYRIDPDSGTPTRVWKDPLGRGDVWENQIVIWNMDAVAGKVYMATDPEARIYEYDTATGKVTNMGRASQANDTARSISATEDTVYVGCGQVENELIAIDRQTGERENIQPSEYGDEYPYYIKTTDDYIIGQLNDTYRQLIIDRDDYSNYWIAEGMGPPALYANTIYHTTHRLDDGVALYRYDPDAREHIRLFSVPSYAHVFVSESKKLMGRDRQAVQVYDIETGETDVYDLLQEGMQPIALTPQSVGTVKGTPIVSTHGKLHIHHDTGVPEQVDAPGEAKRMVTVGDTLYQAVYPNALIAEYRLGVDEAQTVANIGKEQNRPRDMVYQHATGLLLVGTKPDYGLLGGAIAAYNVETGDLTVDRNVIQDQTIKSVATVGKMAYLGSNIAGGGNAVPVADEAKFAAWDPVARTKLWELTPVEGESLIKSLTAIDGLVYGVTGSNDLFVVDPEERAVVHRQSINGSGQVIVGPDRQLYTASNLGILQVDPDNYSTNRFAASLTAFSGELAMDNDGDFYLVDTDGSHLYRVSNKVTVDVTVESVVEPSNEGGVPVRVDARDGVNLNVSSLRFGTPDLVNAGEGAAPIHGGHEEDGDLVLHFPTQRTGIESDGTVLLAGSTTGGRLVTGTDNVAVTE